jgi:hypothetical protein
MHIEVDQSGKIGSKGPTVLAFSNNNNRAILIPADVKREIILTLRSLGKTGKTFYLQLFSVGLFLLLKDYINKVSLVTIDPEYWSKDKDIKRHLFNLFRAEGTRLDTDKIRFMRITKKSRAHRLANGCLNKEIEPDKIVTAKELLGFFESNKLK